MPSAARTPRTSCHEGASMMRNWIAGAACAAGIVLAATACSSSSSSTAATPAASSATAQASSPAAGATGQGASSAGATVGLQAITGIPGQALVDAKGRTLYLCEADKHGTSTCSGACAAAWPPV